MMNLTDYYFDVEEKPISLSSNPSNPLNGYKAIVAPSNEKKDQLVSVVKDSYKLVRNQELIEPFLENVDALGVQWYIDPSHSFVSLNRMRLQLTFPELNLKDSESDIPLSLYLHNSYDMSEGIRLFWGAIRAICTNGMVMGNLLGSYYARHTQGFTFDHIEDHVHQATDRMQLIQQRIQHLDSVKVDEALMKQLQVALGKRRLADIADMDSVPDQSHWELLNDITYYISHREEKPRRADLQLKVSRAFGL